MLCHGNVFKLRGWFGNLWRASWSWPRSGYPLVRFLSFFSGFFVVHNALGSGKFYAGSTLVLWPSWVSEMWWREQDEGTLAVWTNTRPERKCIAGLFGVLFWLWITYYGLQPTVYVNLAPWTGYLPLVLISIRVLIIFWESNLLCSFVFQFVHFILLHFILFCLSFCIISISLSVVKCNL